MIKRTVLATLAASTRMTGAAQADGFLHGDFHYGSGEVVHNLTGYVRFDGTDPHDRSINILARRLINSLPGQFTAVANAEDPNEPYLHNADGSELSTAWVMFSPIDGATLAPNQAWQNFMNEAADGDEFQLVFTFQGLSLDYALNVGGADIIQGFTPLGASLNIASAAGGTAQLMVQGADGAVCNAGTVSFATRDAGGGFAGPHADHLTQHAGTALAADLLSEAGWLGRVELGASADLGRGLGLDASVELIGLGGDMQTVSGGLRLAFTF